MSAPSSLALGFDLSTQQLKVVAIDVHNLETFYEQSLTFETDFPHYKTTKGVYSNEQTHEVYSPVEMWIEAVDVILGTMKDDGFPFADVVSISGAGQVIQHCLVGGLIVATCFSVLDGEGRGNSSEFEIREIYEGTIIPKCIFSSLFTELAGSFHDNRMQPHRRKGRRTRYPRPYHRLKSPPCISTSLKLV